MNDFIVWDKRYKVFRKLLKIDFRLGLYFCIDTVVPFEKGELIKNIDLKDINEKSIYADSCIVEFDKCSQDGHSEQLKGFIRESSPMIFQIVILDNDIWNVLYWHEFRHSIKNLKIIDTIQENKLGLIK